MGEKTSKPRKPRQSQPLGVYVPPPREKHRSIDERIAVRSKVVTIPDFLDAEPRPDERAGELARLIGTTKEDWERRKAQHLDFLEAAAAEYVSGSTSALYYAIRNYIRNAPYGCAGEWKDDRWEWWRAQPTDRDRVRQHLIDVFREVLGDAVCPHGDGWENWGKLPDWVDPWGKQDYGYNSVGCVRCYAEYKLIKEGKSPDLLNFPDAKNIKNGNVLSANIILSMLGCSKWAGVLPNSSTAGGSKLAQIDAAQQRDRSFGGKRIRAAGNGPDSSDSIGDDRSAGSQTNSTEPNYKRKYKKYQLGLTNEAKKIRAEFRASLT
jgi:hypothetical protein